MTKTKDEKLVQLKKHAEAIPDEPIDYKARMTDNSALKWFPPLVTAGLPVPKTVIVEFDPDDFAPILDGKPIADSFPMDAMIAAVEQVGLPCFVRTDLSSAKHDGPRSYRLDTDDKEALLTVLARTFEENLMKMMFETPLAFMFREWLELPSPFTAFGGHKIAREWRLFVEDGVVTHRYFYWPAKAIEDHLDEEDPSWFEKYAEICAPLSYGHMQNLESVALVAVHAVGGGGWSVDFAKDVNGTWWLIDMALAKDSWRPGENDQDSG